MKCLRSFATDDGKSCFDEAEIGMTARRSMPKRASSRCATNTNLQLFASHEFQQARAK